jgi:carbamoyltransferase
MTQWIAGITRGHNAGVCLLKDGEIVFAVEEERLTRAKYDGGPLASIFKILDYTDRLDYLVVAHTQPIGESVGVLEYCGQDPYTALARKLGLIDRKVKYGTEGHPQVIDYGKIHHKLHAACAFYRSGFDSAVAVVVDGAGTFLDFSVNGRVQTFWETETIFGCDYPSKINPIYRHLGGNGPVPTQVEPNFPNAELNSSEDGNCFMIVDGTPGIVKAYEAVTQYCGFHAIEAGKTMGLFPYGEPNDNIPSLFNEEGKIGEYVPTNLGLLTPTYPNASLVNENTCAGLATPSDIEMEDWTRLQNRRDLAYKVQTETQEKVFNLIRAASSSSGNPNVVVSGGYGLNCVANYWYLDQLKDEGINIYVEPISNDAGTAIGAALLHHYVVTGSNKVMPYAESLYLGPKYSYSIDEIIDAADKYGAEVTEGSDQDVIDLITNKNIVAMFQGRSESGPRALGNRSILYDPRDPEGKDFVNKVKRREYFRPFAGSILKEHVHEWFDLRGMDETPHMMYAVNCQPGIEEKIPSIIHVDGTCRIQTVTEEQNENYYKLIKAFYDVTGCPILFNTSFNLGGEPLVETLDDAIRTLANSDIEYLYLPEYGKLITLKND